jgi:ribosome maturation factor RimP
VEGLGYYLVELKISPQRGVTQVQSVVASRDPSENISVNDCAKVHRILLARLEEILGTDNISMELSSPGMERNIKNAAEFKFFVGRKIRVFSKSASDWIGGELLSSDSEKLSLKVESENPEKDGQTKTVEYQDIAKAKFIHI